MPPDPLAGCALDMLQTPMETNQLLSQDPPLHSAPPLPTVHAASFCLRLGTGNMYTGPDCENLLPCAAAIQACFSVDILCQTCSLCLSYAPVHLS